MTVPDLPKTNRVDPRRARTREAILAAARQLFGEHYVEGVGVDEIIRAAGVSKQSFYNHFGDKDALVRDILVALRNEWSGRALAMNAGEPDPARRLATTMCSFAHRAAHHPVEGRLFARLPLLEVVIDVTLGHGVAHDIRHALATGRLGLFNVETGTAFVVGGTQSLVVRVMADDNPALAQIRSQQFVTLVLRALALPPVEAELIASEAAERVFAQMDTSLRAQ